ncbi:E3 ubiquitin-protein ligase PUB24-like [Cicer arietinum]|uniref:U-box domain-containing protein n=1 Tax=Cicer arietinum TaxID=3827 RepID=A0A1S2Y167_CICAR|nr:E3 ubiquitin-protein ligase PUB24-like [Cicer arietinum]
MDEIEVPQYFICPISLQIMKDPVTAITGITYDRDSIEHWLFTNKNTTYCPVTKQPLPLDSDLTPNHTLRRLIQSWCTQNASLGIDRIPTPKPPLTKTHVLKLLKNFDDPSVQLKSLIQLELLAAENERNRKCLLEARVPKAMILFIVDCYRKKGSIFEGLEEALSFLQFVKVPTEEINNLLAENDDIIDSLIWVLSIEVKNSIFVKSHAILVLKRFINKVNTFVLERLKPEFFERIVKILRKDSITQQGLCSALQVLLCACPLGRNRLMMVEVGAVFELVEVELISQEKRITELTFSILFHLCSCANGRAQFLSHEGSIALLSERILKVSMDVDDRAVFILSLISKFSATKIVLQEMLNVGIVNKLFMLLQANHAKYLKDKAMEIIKSHSDVWKNSPCFPQTFCYESLHW